MSLNELFDAHNPDGSGRRNPQIPFAFDGFAVLVNGNAVPASEARERALEDGDKVYIIPLLDGG
jgi:sulfur carrier protein ThiS